MKPIIRLQIGKNGLTDNFISQAKAIFEHEKAIKISLLKSATRNKEEAMKIGNELVGKLGSGAKYKLIGYTLVVKRGRKV